MHNIIEISVREDLGHAGDVTSRAVIPDDHRSRARIIARQKGVIAGLEYSKEVFLKIDRETAVELRKSDGDSVPPGETILQVEGYTQSLLSAERTALNFLGHLSGVATLTRFLVDKVAGTGVKILDTRKTLPGLRIPEKEAVRAGGGYNHRFALFDMMLIKENHIVAAGGITPALQRAHEYDRKVGGRLEIEIEVRNMEELAEAVEGQPDRIMLDNFSLDDVRRAVEFVKGRVPLEVSGGVNENNIRAYAEAGPDYISVGSITASAPALDLSMLVEGIE